LLPSHLPPLSPSCFPVFYPYCFPCPRFSLLSCPFPLSSLSLLTSRRSAELCISCFALKLIRHLDDTQQTPDKQNSDETVEVRKTSGKLPPSLPPSAPLPLPSSLSVSSVAKDLISSSLSFRSRVLDSVVVTLSQDIGPR